ncbi:MAG: sensor histidine kinase [Candidatus Geothermincolia bacterium]
MDIADREEKKAILTLDKEGRILSCNDSGLKIFGYGLAEIQAMNIADILRAPGEGRLAFDDLVRDIDEAQSSTIVKKQELPASRKGGKEFPVEAIFSWEAEEDTIIAMVYDLSRVPTVNRRDDILEAEKLYRLIAENVDDVVLILSIESAEIIYVTESVKKQLGFDPEELMSKPMHNYVSPESLQLLLKTYVEQMQKREDAVESERMTKIDLKMFRKDGAPVDIEATISWIRNDEGQAIAVLAVMRDVSVRKRYEAELKKKNRELEDYAHVVSHDLQTPLSGVSLILDSIIALTGKEQSSAGWSNVNELARHASANVRASQGLVKDILKLAEAGKRSDLISTIDVAEVVERVVSENKVEIDNRGLDIKVGDDLGEVRANPSHIYQVFSNLIGNAVKYCDSDNPVVEVVRVRREEDGGARYLIRDNGSGINPEEIDRIFQPFYRGKSGGSGIGLATVERILEEYQGSIRAFNDDGACFEFSIPDSASP